VYNGAVMDRHTLAAINLAGTLLDLLGGLYLAYDLLGGRKGPLRIITRIGALLVLLGFGLQSLQYWVVLLNIPVREPGQSAYGG
jgi:hypothetical protein